MLCDKCSCLVQRACTSICPDGVITLPTHDINHGKTLLEFATSLNKLVAVARQGCYLCYASVSAVVAELTLRGVARPTLEARREDVYLRAEASATVEADGLKYLAVFHYGIERESDRDFRAIIQVGILPVSSGISCRFPSAFEIPSTTGDPKVLTVARNWLEVCLAEHPTCGKSPQVYWPSRVVDTRPRGASGYFRVMKANAIRKSSRYVTLSHRWGTDTPRLTRKNEDYYDEGAPWSEVPQTFRDAFILANFLGFRYIWIDSLCISQDDRLDMVKEALTMIEVYSNGVCNISALMGETTGIFASRDPSHVSVKMEHAGYSTRQRPKNMVLRDNSLWAREVDNAPLGGRGWVLQEQLLAQRTLFFSPNQVLWECGQGRRSESCPALANVFIHPPMLGRPASFKPAEKYNGTLWSADAGLRNYVHRASKWSLMKPHQKATQSDAMVKRFDMSFDLWYMLVHKYTVRTISFPKDKLLAISGLAKLFARTSSLTWAGGIWKEHMPLTLLWQVYKAETRSSAYCAPSWSWASIQGLTLLPNREDYDDIGSRVVAEVVHVECAPVGDDPFGFLSEACYLKIRAFSMPVFLDQDAGTLGISLMDTVVFPQNVLPDHVELPFNGTFELYTVTPNEVQSPTSSQLDPLSSFLAIAIYTHAQEEQPNKSAILAMDGLILEAITNTAANNHTQCQYRRVGIFHLTNYVVAWSDEIARRNEIFNLSTEDVRAVKQTHAPFHFETATCLEEFTVV